MSDTKKYTINEQLARLGINHDVFITFYQYMIKNRKVPDIGYIPATDRQLIYPLLQEHRIINKHGKINESNMIIFQKQRILESLDEKIIREE